MFPLSHEDQHANLRVPVVRFEVATYPVRGGDGRVASATGHLQSPVNTVYQTDHLLSLVRPVWHRSSVLETELSAGRRRLATADRSNDATPTHDTQYEIRMMTKPTVCILARSRSPRHG